MTRIDRQQLRQMMQERAVTVVEVPDRQEYDRFHLPVAVYRLDADCGASPRAPRKTAGLPVEA